MLTAVSVVGDSGVEGLAGYFKALGDPTRLRIFEFLVKHCCPVALGEAGAVRPEEGPSVGEVCCHITGLDQSSRISFHLKELRVAGLIHMEKRGKYNLCRPNLEALEKLAAFFGEPIRGNRCD